VCVCVQSHTDERFSRVTGTCLGSCFFSGTVKRVTCTEVTWSYTNEEVTNFCCLTKYLPQRGDNPF